MIKWNRKKEKNKEKNKELKTTKIQAKEKEEKVKKTRETKSDILERKKIRKEIAKKKKINKILDNIKVVLNSNKIFKKMYIVLIIILTILLIILPKQKYIDGIDYQETTLEILEDGIIDVKEKIVFEKNLTKIVDVYKEINDKDISPINIKVFGNTLFKKEELKVIEGGDKIQFEKNPKYLSYEITYTTKRLVGVYSDNYYALKMPISTKMWQNSNQNLIVESPKWINRYNLKVKFKNSIENRKFANFFMSLPSNTLRLKDNQFNLQVYNFPPNNNGKMYLIFEKNQINEKYGKDFEKIVMGNVLEIEKVEKETFKKFLEHKKARNYNEYVYRKYLTYALYVLIILQYLYYILDIINGLKNKKRINFEKDLRKTKNNKLGNNLLLVYILNTSTLYNNILDIKNLVTAILVKLNEYNYIQFEKKGVYILDKTEKELQQLDYIDKYILEKIYRADVNNVNFVEYSDLEKMFRKYSSKIIDEIHKQIDYENVMLTKKGIYSRRRHRTDFSIILILILPLTLFTLFKYIDIKISILVFILTYILAKTAKKINEYGFTLKGINIKKNLLRYEQYIKWIQPKEISKENAIFKTFFGYNKGKIKNIENIEEISEVIVASLNLKHFKK